MDAVGRERLVLLDKLRVDLCPEAWQPTRSPSLVARLVLGGGLGNLTNKLVPLDKPQPPVTEPVYKAAVGGRDTAPMALVDTEVSKQARTAHQLLTDRGMPLQGELATRNRSEQATSSTHPTDVKKTQMYAPYLSGKTYASSAYSMPYECSHCGRGLKNADSKAHHENVCLKYYKQQSIVARDRQARSPLKVPSQIPQGYRVLSAPKDRDAHRVIPTWSITHKTT